MQMLVRSKLGFEPIQNRSGLKRRPRRVLSVLRLHSPAHPSTRPSIHPSPGVSTQLSGHTQNTSSLVCKRKGKKKNQLRSFRRLCSRSEQLYQHQQNHQPTSSRLHVHQGASSEPTHTVYKGTDSARDARALPSAADERNTFSILGGAVGARGAFENIRSPPSLA